MFCNIFSESELVTRQISFAKKTEESKKEVRRETDKIYVGETLPVKKYCNSSMDSCVLIASPFEKGD